MKNYLFLLLCLPCLSLARFYNYQDVPFGERSAGMGLTAVAASSDVGDAFYNPASVADLKSPMIGAAVSSYARIDDRSGEYESFFDSVKRSLVQGSVESIPAFVGGNFNTKGWVWGGGVYVPSSLSFNGVVRGDAEELVTYQSESTTTHLLAFVSKRWDKWSYGASISFATFSESERFLHLYSVNPNDIEVSEYFFSSNTAFLSLGSAVDLTESIRFGASVSIPLLLLGGGLNVIDVRSGSSSLEDADYDISGIASPVRLSGGIQWKINSKFVVAADLHLYSGFTKNLAPSEPSQLFLISAKPIANLNLGMQWRGWEWVGFRLGVFSNLSSRKNVKFKDLATLQDSINMVGATAGVYFPTPTGSISLGGFFQGGQGRMPNIIEDAQDTKGIPRSTYVYGAVVGSTYFFD